jgi:hypothetical protein
VLLFGGACCYQRGELLLKLLTWYFAELEESRTLAWVQSYNSNDF